MEIGAYLKKLRKEKNYTLNDVATKTKMSASLLSQLENDKASPSLNSLQVLLRFYGVGLSAFFNQVEKNDYLIVKSRDAETFSSKSEKVTLTFLASKLQNTKNVSYKVQLEPQSEIVIAQLDDEIQGERFMYIMSGSVEIIINKKEKFILHTDDSIICRSFVSFKVLNPGQRVSKLIVTGTPPLF
ncbi:MAG TPA: helix-turn-helix domain-containing protein [Spirochaetota bacterium]|nr:helix-turn-helix domain-containing protein [Spirochaetota bacterium]HQF10616.1 helix-turn-helix domain-containing protein [Spirochaetota bacterium]HQH99595.1 helix-turn-helix domain-containing protein [Spirochaetota bacterium]HQJ73179.1 helix-turn-helix domain-containing protein [Spirochaetota bacterium]